MKEVTTTNPERQTPDWSSVSLHSVAVCLKNIASSTAGCRRGESKSIQHQELKYNCLLHRRNFLARKRMVKH